MKFPTRFPLVIVPFVLALAVQVQAADPAPADDKGKAKEPAKMNKEELRIN